ncbi:biopolymer transporter ExbB [Halobacteriovorax marinus]|uniref:Transport-related protein n=1 Tax=Halobacteriovorax marinus (strain ATCC BAA-682 / DSM 15412 / SJ) TaxID=862908 RepID=E1X4W4_HALMS|nr:MotA/TolQ/ExbB proton channel family protein [Halobacteriovorax marinus]ATH08496.1 biopolymer transporter ExbB [Halobacteriovorax marinus]CBW27190.1 putative transport-related protein [Halobacteriovorax marinus SJ]
MRVIDYIEQGGVIMYILLALNIIGFAIMISKFFILTKESKRSSQVANELSDRVKTVTKDSDTNTIIEIAKQELSNHIAGLEKGLNTVKIIASISPLLGLLGTVIGVLVAFKVMSQTGLNNPASFAQGISMALITTVGGMIVAIPHYIGHNYLIGMVDQFETRLEKELLSDVL